MIKFKTLNKEDPYLLFQSLYSQALSQNQSNIEAIAISSISLDGTYPNSRYVNLKYIDNDKWYFFTSFDSPKSKEFSINNNVFILIFWSSINIQIRLKAKIYKCSDQFSDSHFKSRSLEKNALAISSKQSSEIDSFKEVENNYKQVIEKSKVIKLKRPNYWGGYYFIPSYFEFWEGNKNRLNKRTFYLKNKNVWNKGFLSP